MFQPLTARASATAAAVILALAAGAGPASGKNGGGGGEGQPGNPPGNNGTVKIDSVPFDDHPGNEPHVDCTFQVDFYNFDQDDLWADVSFELKAPTGSGQLAASPNRVFIGQDPAGGHDGGDDLDAAQAYDLSGPLAASGAQPHPQQGYHVKLTIHADGSQGADVKHKVFWIEPCAGAPVSGEVGGQTDGMSRGGSGGSADVAGSQTGKGGAALGSVAARPDSASVLGQVAQRSDVGGPAADAEVLGAQYSRGPLARTGLDIGLTTGAALVLLVMGLGLRRAARAGE